MKSTFLKNCTSTVSFGLLITALSALPSFAENEPRTKEVASTDRSVEVGKLTCTVLENTRRNYIVRSTAQVDCEYKGNKGIVELYKGVTGIQLGIDLSVREKDTLRFAVFSSRKVGEKRPEFALEGKYFGASATASVTYGIGAAALIGGSRKEISLQPLGIETIRGLGLSAGLGFLYLERDGAA